MITLEAVCETREALSSLSDECIGMQNNFEDLVIERMAAEDDMRRILSVIASLPQADTTMATLRWVHGLSIRKIAVLYHCHHTTMSRRLRTIATCISDRLGEDRSI